MPSEKCAAKHISPQMPAVAKRLRNFCFSFTSPIEIFSSVLQPAGIPFFNTSSEHFVNDGDEGVGEGEGR